MVCSNLEECSFRKIKQEQCYNYSMQKEYTLSWNSLFGFVITDSKKDETPLSNAAAIKWSKKLNVATNLIAQKQLKDII